jgi:hypothetical protein
MTLVRAEGVSKHFATKVAWPRPRRGWHAITRMSATVQAVSEVDLAIERG